jgi:hypothetical protein
MPPPGNSFYDQVLSRVIAKLVPVAIELGLIRIAVGTHITMRPPHRAGTCGFPAYGSHLGYLTA